MSEYGGSIWGEHPKGRERKYGSDSASGSGNSREVSEETSKEIDRAMAEILKGGDKTTEPRDKPDTDRDTAKGSDMIHLKITHSTRNLPETLGITDERAKEIVQEVHRNEKSIMRPSDTLKWACFTEQLVNVNERVFALYVIGGDACMNQMAHEGKDKLKHLLKDMLESAEGGE